MFWLELEIRAQADAVRVSARGSRGERAREQDLPGFTVQRLMGFRVAVGNAIARAQVLEGEVLEQARELHEALLSGGVRDLFVRLLAAAGEQRQRLLVRLILDDPNLQAVPWEAACRPQTNHGFLAAAADLLLARGVPSVEPWQPRELRHALRVLPVLALPDQAALVGLQQVMQEHIDSGAVELLPAISGDAARNPILFERLRSGPSPHVLHFLGHGGFDEQRNPVIRLADDEHGGRSFLPIEVFAEELRANFDTMRLIYLQACSGARPGVFASAAELLARAGVDAVVAHLWPVRADVARLAAQDFYSHLVGARTGGGDVGASTQASRRSLLASSADGLSPVLFLRGSDARLFDLEDRRLRPPRAKPPPSQRPAIDELPAPLAALLHAPFSLLLGTAWDEHASADVQAGLRDALQDALKLTTDVGTPLYALAQRYVLANGRLKLDRLFQKSLLAAHSRHDTSSFVDALAPRLRPGVHVTLLWLPLLEHAISRHHPERTLHVIQPGPPGHEERRLVMTRRPGRDDWEEVEALPPLHLEHDFVVLRLYGGYSPEAEPILLSPQLTEDDHIQGLFELRYIVPPEWDSHIMGWVRTHPVLCAGVSALDWRHRMLLRLLFDQRPPPQGSLALLADEQGEDEIWEKRGAGLPGTGHVATVRCSLAALAQALRGDP